MISPALIALFLVLGLIILVADSAAAGDIWHIKQQDEVSHIWGARLRALLLALPAVAFVVPLIKIVPHATLWILTKAALFICYKLVIFYLLFCSQFWLYFDIFLNKRWGKDWKYIGQTARSDQFWNKLFYGAKHPGLNLIIIKVGVFSLFLYLVILTI